MTSSLSSTVHGCLMHSFYLERYMSVNLEVPYTNTYINGARVEL